MIVTLAVHQQGAGPKMPDPRVGVGSVGIQLFATITSKDHYTSLQRDLVGLAGHPALQDTTLHCTDGSLLLSRLLVGLVLPDLHHIPSFSTAPDLSLLMPQHTKAEVESLLTNLLSPRLPQETGEAMSEWTDAIDTIIDNLEPEREQTKSSATLHSSLTKETAVLHSAQEEETYSESVLVVAEDTPADQDTTSRRRCSVGGAPPPAPGAPPAPPAAAPLLTVPNPQPRLMGGKRLPEVVSKRQEPPAPHPVHCSSDVEILPSPRKASRGKLVFSCPVCHEQFRAQDVMEEHLKIHSDKHKCPTCGIVCTKARELIEHQRVHSGAKLVKCNICEKDFTEKGLKLHTDRFHKIEKNLAGRNNRTSKDNVNYMEDKITFTSSSDSDPDEPEVPKVKVTKVKRTELCELCEKYFTKKGIKLHISRYHQETDPAEAEKRQKKDKKKNPPLKKLFTCGFCEKKFSHLASMKVHEKVHLGGKPHQCDMCEAKFSNKFDLFAHEKTHADARPYKCDECSETFKTAESLRFHKLIHVESQPNICRFCKKCFKNKNQLDLHERVHVGEKPFKCTHCDQCYETASKLTRHITATHMS